MRKKMSNNRKNMLIKKNDIFLNSTHRNESGFPFFIKGYAQ